MAKTRDFQFVYEKKTNLFKKKNEYAQSTELILFQIYLLTSWIESTLHEDDFNSLRNV
jgi:hypothetical protein